MSISGKGVMELVIRARNDTRGAFDKIGTQMRGTKNDTKGLNKGLGIFRSTLGSLPGPVGRLVGALGPLGLAGAAIAAGAAIGLFASSAVKAFTAFEDSMANVRKTTGMSKEEIHSLGNEIDTMALRLPVAHGELAKIAAIAGQLGIVGSTNILSFTQTVAEMSTSFDMAAEDVAVAMAKLGKIYDIPIEQTSNLGSAINVLGNTTGAFESQIIDFSMTLGPTGQQLGFVSTEILALGASMIEMGVNSSDAGTRLNRAFSMIGQNMDKLSKFMGVSTAEFAKDFENMPMETFISVIEKLSTIDGKLERNTKSVELFGEIGSKSIKSLMGNLDGLKTNLANAATGYKENTSLAEEFAAKTDTLKAKFALLSNAAESFKINAGQALAPLAGALAAGAAAGISGISKAFSAIQKVAGPVLDLLFIKFHALRAFLEGLFEPIMNALKPLSGIFGDTSGAVSNLNTVLKVMKDVFIIITGVAGKLGTILGTLLAKAITPLVAKIKEGIATLTEFYNKLGPVKGLFEGIKDKVGAGADAIGKWADSFTETVPPVEELTEAVSELTEEAKTLEPVLSESIKTLGPVLSESIKTLESSLTEASGSYKTAIGDISKEIDTLKDAWNLASDDQKKAIEDQIDVLEEVRAELEDGEKAQKEYFEAATEGAEDASKAQKEFKVTIGDTTITFKDMAAEVVKNADAYKDLEGNAKALLDLDWSVFTELEAKLPNIDAGIQDMSDAFSGLKVTLEENAENLETVKKSVIEIGTIAAPFLEKGFTKGIESISNFAGSLSAAGTAINSFGDLTEVNVEGCINFSTSVYSMVSALGVLETQMHDMKPAFADMKAGMRATLEAFVYPGGGTADIEARITRPIEEYKRILKKYGLTGDWAQEWYDETYHGATLNLHGKDLEEYALEMIGIEGGDLAIFAGANRDYNKAMRDIYGSRRAPGVGYSGREYEISRILEKEGGDIAKYASGIVRSSKAIEIAVNKQVQSLNYWSGQLTKITDALKPYLSFMQTLNEITALSTLSIDDINAGFDAISNTLTNLSMVIKDVDFAPIMDALFGEYKGEGIFAGGAATDFITLMQTYSPKLNELVTFTDNLSGAITNLTSAFDALVDIEDSVLMDTNALGSLLSDVETIVNNLAEQLSSKGGNFGAILTDSFTELLKAADPLIIWFRKNSVQVTEFNSALGSLMLTIKHISDAMKSLQEIAAATVPEVGELAAGFDKAAEFVTTFDEAFIKHLDTHKTLANMSFLTGIEKFAKDWETATKGMEDSFKTFGIASSNILTLINTVVGLSKALLELRDTTIISMRDMDKALKNVDVFIGRFTEALHLNFDTLVDSLTDLHVEWGRHSKEMEEIMPTYETATGNVGTLISTLLSLTGALKSLAETGTISSTKFDTGFTSIVASIANFTKSLQKNVDTLIISLSNMRTAWIENESTLVPLMKDFRTITRNLASLAYNANLMSNAFSEFSKNSGRLKLGFERLIDFINQVVAATKKFYTPESARAIAQYITDVGRVIWAFRHLGEQLDNATSDIEKEVKNAVNTVAARVLSLKTLIPNMFVYGAMAIIGFAKGMNAYKSVLEGVLISIANMIKAYLGVSSNTQLGALSAIEDWPKNLVKTFTSGIKSEMGGLNASFGAMALTAPGGGSGGNTTHITFNVTQNINSRATSIEATNDLERMLQKHELL